jgi:competence protein ComEA
MDFEQLLKNYSPFIKRNLLSLVLGLVGLIFLGYSVIVLIAGGKSASDEIIFESGKEQVGSSNESQITVDIEGAVLKPGVYQISSNSRLQDALVAAHGLAQSADREWVSKNLNLAQRLTDGAKIYVPKTGENIKEEKDLQVGIENPLKGKINLNTASIKELDGLPGVGMVTAQKIIDNRPYATIDDFLSKKVVNSRVFGQIREKVTVY